MTRNANCLKTTVIPQDRVTRYTNDRIFMGEHVPVKRCVKIHSADNLTDKRLMDERSKHSINFTKLFENFLRRSYEKTFALSCTPMETTNVSFSDTLSSRHEQSSFPRKSVGIDYVHGKHVHRVPAKCTYRCTILTFNILWEYFSTGGKQKQIKSDNRSSFNKQERKTEIR